MAAIVIPAECVDAAQRHRPGANYAASVTADFAMIEPHLPEKVVSIIDIGCGVAGIDVHLKRKYPDAHLTLLDGDGGASNVGFSEKGAFGGDKKAAELLLEANGIKVDRWLPIGTKEPLEADLIVSLLSWGFHYPLSAYKVKGLCIADIRRGQKANGKLIWRALKSDRMVWAC
jgi:hypothetical protein